MAVNVTTAVWDFAGQRLGARLTLLALADFSDKFGYCWPSVAVLAQRTGVTERQVVRIIRKLQDDGVLTVERNAGPKRRNLYRIILPSIPNDPDREGDISDRVTSVTSEGDISDAQRVTFATKEGDIRDTALKVLDPSEEPSEEEPSEGREGQALTPLTSNIEVDRSTGEILELQPEWAVELMTLPVFKGRLIGKAVVDIEHDFASISLALEARSFVAWWSEGRRRLERPMAAWRTWLRKAQTYQAQASGGESPDPLDAYRKSYGRYLKQEANT